jgi:nucleoside-diphosphate-sugar epimerase
MSLTERFDSSILSSLAAAPQCLYVAFSSGSVFGTHLANPIARGQLASIDPATRSASIGYSVAKLNSEIKHRLNPVLNIVDIRLYGYFSRFQPPVGSYLMSDIVYCLREKTTLETGGADLIRDYIHPKDLLQLIVCSAQARPINTALDAYSRAPTGKFALLDRLGDEFGLKYHISDVLSQTATNTRPQYYSTDHAAHELGFEPNFSAIDAVVDECRALLDRKPCG